MRESEKICPFGLRSYFILVIMLTQMDGSIVPYGYQCLNDGNKAIFCFRVFSANTRAFKVHYTYFCARRRFFHSPPYR